MVERFRGILLHILEPSEAARVLIFRVLFFQVRWLFIGKLPDARVSLTGRSEHQYFEKTFF
jgi:hypothetical protein